MAHNPPDHSADRIRPEFSRPLPVDRGSPPRRTFAIEATEAERAGLAKRFGLVSLAGLRAEGLLESLDDGRRAHLTARLTAQVVQSCVVTLAPVSAAIDESFVRDYDVDADPAALSEPEIPEDIEAFLAEADPPDPLIGGIVDVGEAVAEQLALALDPYPRAPSASFAGSEGQEATEDSPFKALAGLVKKGRP